MAVPAENNPVINPQYFQPSKFAVSAISKGATTTITMTPSTIRGITTYPNYVVGQLVRVVMSAKHGMRQMDNRQGYVLSLPSSTSVEVDIDSRFFDNFVANPSGETTPAQIVSVGDINSGVVNSSGRTSLGTYVLGSFINISPN